MVCVAGFGGSTCDRDGRCFVPRDLRAAEPTARPTDGVTPAVQAVAPTGSAPGRGSCLPTGAPDSVSDLPTASATSIAASSVRGASTQGTPPRYSASGGTGCPGTRGL